MSMPGATAHADWIPRRAVLGGVAAVVACLLATGAARLAGYPARDPEAPVADRRALRFVDRQDGGIDVVDADTDTLLETLHGEQGFVRGVLRGVLRERKRHGAGSQQALELMARADGRLTLADPASGARIDLESFGTANTAVFARWLPNRRTQEQR